jgi:hypothetical protein
MLNVRARRVDWFGVGLRAQRILLLVGGVRVERRDERAGAVGGDGRGQSRLCAAHRWFQIVQVAVPIAADSACSADGLRLWTSPHDFVGGDGGRRLVKQQQLAGNCDHAPCVSLITQSAVCQS